MVYYNRTLMILKGGFSKGLFANLNRSVTTCNDQRL